MQGLGHPGVQVSLSSLLSVGPGQSEIQKEEVNERPKLPRLELIGFGLPLKMGWVNPHKMI